MASIVARASAYSARRLRARIEAHCPPPYLVQVTLTERRADCDLYASAVGRNGLQSRMGIARLRDVPWSAPSMLNIEHLRKQAKLYLRWHREQYYPVAARIRAVLPRYSRLIDREILAQPFRLSDAQELVARTVGFESWEALRRGSHS